ncbi:hypothetical protein CEXT_64241, partial [Caerostris extrusa]
RRRLGICQDFPSVGFHSLVTANPGFVQSERRKSQIGSWGQSLVGALIGPGTGLLFSSAPCFLPQLALMSLAELVQWLQWTLTSFTILVIGSFV